MTSRPSHRMPATALLATPSRASAPPPHVFGGAGAARAATMGESRTNAPASTMLGQTILKPAMPTQKMLTHAMVEQMVLEPPDSDDVRALTT